TFRHGNVICMRITSQPEVQETAGLELLLGHAVFLGQLLGLGVKELPVFLQLPGCLFVADEARPILPPDLECPPPDLLRPVHPTPPPDTDFACASTAVGSLDNPPPHSPAPADRASHVHRVLARSSPRATVLQPTRLRSRTPGCDSCRSNSPSTASCAVRPHPPPHTT